LRGYLKPHPISELKMSTSSLFANLPASVESKVTGFNLVNQVNSFNSFFDIKPLDQSESASIENLLVENFQHGLMPENRIEVDLDQLKQITADIKAIGRQATVLIGERVYKAKELLKPYRNGTFTKWLESTFGSRKTGYNMLSYYELFQALPHEELKEQFKKIPQRIAYTLASKSGDIEKKAEIIRNSHEKSTKDLENLIQEAFPVASGDKRIGKDANSKAIDVIREALFKLRDCKDTLSEENKMDLNHLRSILEGIIS